MSSKTYFPSFLMYTVKRFCMPRSRRSSWELHVVENMSLWALQISFRQDRRKSHPDPTEQPNPLLGEGENGTQILVFRDGKSANLLQGRLSVSFVNGTSLSWSHSSSDGLCLWFWECSSRTASMRRKWSILSVEMCTIAFWKSCTFGTTCEYCLILCKIESGWGSVLAVVAMLPNV